LIARGIGELRPPVTDVHIPQARQTVNRGIRPSASVITDP
jgi:hypothetical protein